MPYGGAQRRGDRESHPRRLRAAVPGGMRAGRPGVQHGFRGGPAAACSGPGCRASGAPWPAGQRPRHHRAHHRGGDGPALGEELERRADKIEKLDILGIFSTPATAGSRVYEIEIAKRGDASRCSPSPAGPLARQIEAGEAARGAAAGGRGARRCRRPPHRPAARPAILGCTHYEIIADLFRAALPGSTPLIQQPDATADACERYLARHPEYHAGGRGRAASSPPAHPARSTPGWKCSGANRCRSRPHNYHSAGARGRMLARARSARFAKGDLASCKASVIENL